MMADPEKRRKYNLKQRIRGHGFKKYKPELYAEQGMCCNLCGDLFDFFDLHIDHKHPLCRADEYPGDINEKENLHLLCPPCNYFKGTRTWDELLEATDEVEQWLNERQSAMRMTQSK